jgi:hypothetical protein
VSPTLTARWTTPAALRAQVRRRWDDGTLLRALAAGSPFPEMDLPVRGPRAGEIGDDLAAVQRWVADLDTASRGGRCYDLVQQPIGGRHFGRNQIPGRARLTTYDQAWQLLGVRDEVAAFDRILAATAGAPAVRAWVAANPLQSLAIADEWGRVVAAFAWLDGARGSGRYLREITAPGVDTKFVERHRPVLAALLGVPRSASGFVSALGLRSKPETLRVRFAAGWLGLPHVLSEATFRAGELAAVRTAVRTAVVVENEATFLSVPVPYEGVVLWGKGFEVDRAGALPWLRDAEVWYWGDIDSHGFAILDQLRARLPQTRSFLMDRQTLGAHRDRWVRDPSPTSARLSRLDRDEAGLYADLVTDNLGEAVRLEQERVDWSWASGRLPYA